MAALLDQHLEDLGLHLDLHLPMMMRRSKSQRQVNLKHTYIMYIFVIHPFLELELLFFKHNFHPKICKRNLKV